MFTSLHRVFVFLSAGLVIGCGSHSTDSSDPIVGVWQSTETVAGQTSKETRFFSSFDASGKYDERFQEVVTNGNVTTTYQFCETGTYSFGNGAVTLRSERRYVVDRSTTPPSLGWRDEKKTQVVNADFPGSDSLRLSEAGRENRVLTRSSAVATFQCEDVTQ